MRYLLLISVLLAGCSSPELVHKQTNYQPISLIEGKSVVIAPIMLNYTEADPDRQTLFVKDKKLSELGSQEQQQQIKDNISQSLCGILEQQGFTIKQADKNSEPLLQDVSNNHAALISEYRSKEPFAQLFSNISNAVGADSTILVEVLVKQGTKAYWDPLITGAAGPGTSSTSFKIAVISNKDAKHKWYGEVYLRDVLHENEIANVLKTLLLR